MPVRIGRRNKIERCAVFVHRPDLIRQHFRFFSRHVDMPLHHKHTIWFKIGHVSVEHSRKYCELDVSAVILHLSKKHRIAFFCRVAFRIGQYASDSNKLTIFTQSR